MQESLFVKEITIYCIFNEALVLQETFDSVKTKTPRD